MTARRLPGPARGSPVTFTFDGREIEGIEGEPLAVSLLAAGRPILSRSFRFHRARGLMCSTGQCGWCECEVDGRPSVRSCRVPVREGLVARGEHALPNVSWDVLSLVGLGSRWVPPTFYHHRFLRPKALRKRYLDVLRWFGGRGRLHVGPRVDPRAALPGRVARRVEADVLVVGGGRAGLLAALGATAAGGRVLLIEREAAIGGNWRLDGGQERAPGTIAELAGKATAAGVQILTAVTAVGWYDGMVAAIGADVHYEIRAGAIVAATGSYDRVPLVPGADRPGVMAARTVIGLIERFGVVPGRNVLLVGDGQELAGAAERLARTGVSVLIGPVSTGSLVAIRGRRQVTAAITRHGRSREHQAVDLVVFGDRSPNLDLVLAAGAAVERPDDTLIPVQDADGRTTVPSLFVAGSAGGRPIDGRLPAELARATGRAAARHASGGTTAPAATIEPTATAHHHPATPIARGAMVCFCEDVRAGEIHAEQAAGYADPELLKRRTGALTGPCQGKYCLQAFTCVVAAGAASRAAISRASPPTTRPPLEPIRLADLVARDGEASAVLDR